MQFSFTLCFIIMYHSGFFFTSLYVIIQGAGGKDMDKNKKVSFDIIVYSMMIVAVIYAIVQSLLGHIMKFIIS